MLEMLNGIHLDILIGIGLSALGAMCFVIRHFWIKTQCFYLMKQRLKQLEKDKEDGDAEHAKLETRITSIEKDTSYIKGKLDTLLETWA